MISFQKSADVKKWKPWDDPKDDHNNREKTPVQFILIGFGEKYSKGVEIDLLIYKNTRTFRFQDLGNQGNEAVKLFPLVTNTVLAGLCQSTYFVRHVNPAESSETKLQVQK